MEKKTFEQIHAEVKLEHGITGIEAINKFRITLPIAIERYANHKASIAFDEGCNNMKGYCRNEYTRLTGEINDFVALSFELIPNPPNPYKTNNND